MTLTKYIIERDIPGVGSLGQPQLCEAAEQSNEALRQLSGKVQWQESFVADNKTSCVYLATDEESIRQHAQISGFPATKITAVRAMIDPTSARSS